MKPFWMIVLLSAGLAVFGGPGLKIVPETFSFGKYPANLPKEHEFMLTNTGDEPLLIEKIRVTCGCSAAAVTQEQLAPGERTSLIARIHKESVAGPYSKGIFIHSNASNGRIQMITLTGEAVPLVTVSPQDKLYLGILQPGREIRQEFLLTTSGGVKFGVPETEGSAKPEVEWKELPGNRVQLIFKWMPDREYPLFRFQIKLPIISPRDWKPVELSLQGQVQKKTAE